MRNLWILILLVACKPEVTYQCVEKVTKPVTTCENSAPTGAIVGYFLTGGLGGAVVGGLAGSGNQRCTTMDVETCVKYEPVEEPVKP